MNLSIFSRLLHLLIAVTLLACGAGLLLAPELLLKAAHGQAGNMGPNSILQLAAAGLLLGGLLPLRSSIRGYCEKELFFMTVAYLAALPLVHGSLAFTSGWWLWLPFALLLVSAISLPAKLPMPSIAGAGNSDMQEGNVKWFNPNKGFGFIETADGDEIFVHFKALTNGGRRSLRQGTRVRYKIKTTDRGDQADEVEILR